MLAEWRILGARALQNLIKSEIVSYPGGTLELHPLRIDELADLVGRHQTALASAANLKPLQPGESPELLALNALLLVTQYMDAVCEVVAAGSGQPDSVVELRNLPPQVLLAAFVSVARLTIEYLQIAPTEILTGKFLASSTNGRMH